MRDETRKQTTDKRAGLYIYDQTVSPRERVGSGDKTSTIVSRSQVLAGYDYAALK